MYLLYLLEGAAAYGTGFALYLKVLRPNRPKGVVYDWRSPAVQKFLPACFAAALGVACVLSWWVLGHRPLDWLYVIVNAAVATFIFYSGLTPDESRLSLPD